MERNARGLAVSNNLWQKIENRNNARKTLGNHNNTDTSLYRAILADKTPANNNTQDIMGGINEGLKGLGTLAGTLKNNTGSNNSDWGSITNEASKLFNNNGTSTNSLGGLFNNSFDTAGSSALDSPENFSNFMGGSSGGSGASNVPWAAIANMAKGGYNAISGKDDKDYSDVEEAIIYPLQGAAMGASYSNGNPWAAAGGALYGLGYAFKDDLGMKDSNFLTQMVFPIGMGDGGGIKIGGKSILDLG